MPDSVMLPTCRFERVSSTIAGGDMILLQLTLPARIFRNVGDMIILFSVDTLAANANSKTTALKFGTTVVAGRTATDNGGNRVCQAWITRISAVAVQAYGLCTTLATATSVVTPNDSISVDFNSPINVTLNCTTGVADGDIVSRQLRYEYNPVNNNFGL